MKEQVHLTLEKMFSQAGHKKSWGPTEGCQIRAVVPSVARPTWLLVVLSLFSFYPSTSLHRVLLCSHFLLTQPVCLTHCFSTFHRQSQLCREYKCRLIGMQLLQSSKWLHRLQGNEYSALLPPLLKQGLLVHSPFPHYLHLDNEHPLLQEERGRKRERGSKHIESNLFFFFLSFFWYLYFIIKVEGNIKLFLALDLFLQD